MAQITWGGKAGLNVSTLGTTGIYSPRLGYHSGFYYSQHIEEQYGVQIELLYSLQGASFGISEARMSYHYMHLPVMMKVYFEDNNYIEVGPQFGYLLSASEYIFGIRQTITSSVRRWDIGGNLGVGHETSFGGIVGVRFNLGFLNANGGQVGAENVFRNIVGQLYFAYRFKEVM